MTRPAPSFLLDAAAAIADAPFDELLDAAERIGLNVRYYTNTYLVSGYGIRASTTAGKEQAVQAWGRKARDRAINEIADTAYPDELLMRVGGLIVEAIDAATQRRLASGGIVPAPAILHLVGERPNPFPDLRRGDSE